MQFTTYVYIGAFNKSVVGTLHFFMSLRKSSSFKKYIFYFTHELLVEGYKKLFFLGCEMLISSCFIYTATGFLRRNRCNPRLLACRTNTYFVYIEFKEFTFHRQGSEIIVKPVDFALVILPLRSCWSSFRKLIDTFLLVDGILWKV